MTVTTRTRRREERGISRKTIARGMPGNSGVPVVTTLVCFFYFAREAMGALGTRHSLRPLLSEARTDLAQLGHLAPRERGVVSEVRATGSIVPWLFDN